ncbi:MAG: glutamate-5-semialdehyde dehydrogenase [Ruminococcaceae bacterium]|nr:glutamate-5-semialdehyde dehydrogenase [Oscillospiraceae bacterium]
MEIYNEIKSLCQGAKAASYTLASKSTKERNNVLLKIAEALRDNCTSIIDANKIDLGNARQNGISDAMLDRLMLNEQRVDGLALAIEHVVSLPDPIGVGNTFTRPNGLKIECSAVPLGVVAMIYEARPNVTPDAASLCLKSGNSVVLRGGKEAINTNKCIVGIIRQTLDCCGFDKNSVCLVENTTRDSANALMEMRGLVDVLIPRGGKGLIQNVVQNAKVPVIETGAGNCHLYVDESADLDMAISVAINAKCSRPSVCNAIETVLVHESMAEKFLTRFFEETRKYSLEFRGCPRTCAILPQISPATDRDFDTEYDDYIISCKVVNDVREAVEHIRKYSTGHSESIITESARNADYFVSSIDSCALYVNASTRFTDGGEFGLGAEIGISTQKLHARGPMGLSALTTTKYIIKGDGHTR